MFSAQACASYSPHLGAQPTGANTTEYSAAADALVLDRGFGPEIFPSPEVGVRRGLGHHWDLGLRVYVFGCELSARHRIYAGGRSRHTLTLVPLLSFSAVNATNRDTSFANASAGSLFLYGIELNPGVELTLGLREQLDLGLNAVAIREDFSASRPWLLTGVQAGLSAPLTRSISLHPGATLLWPYDLDGAGAQSPIIQGGMGATW